MLTEFITQNYLIIQNNVVANVVLWDGDTTQWTPPAGSIALVQATTPAMIWEYVNAVWVLTESVGAGDIGFTWDGSVLTTNQPQPTQPPVIVAADQPASIGTQTL